MILTATSTDTQCTLSDEELTIWLKVMTRPSMAEFSFRVLVLTNVSDDVLVRELSALYYVQLTTKEWDIDVILLAAYTEAKRGDDFVKKFLRYICSNKEYMVHLVKADLIRRHWSKKYLKFVR